MNITAKFIERIRAAYDLAAFLLPKAHFGLAAVYVFVTMAAALVSIGGFWGVVAVYVLGILAAALMMVQAGKLNKAVS